MGPVIDSQAEPGLAIVAAEQIRHGNMLEKYGTIVEGIRAAIDKQGVRCAAHMERQTRMTMDMVDHGARLTIMEEKVISHIAANGAREATLENFKGWAIVGGKTGLLALIGGGIVTGAMWIVKWLTNG